MKTIMNFVLLLLFTLVGQQTVTAQCPLEIQIENFPCSDYTFTVLETFNGEVSWVVNGTDVLTTGTTFTFEALAAGTYHICANYSSPDCPEVTQTCFTIEVEESCFDAIGVWPGDANNNGIVNAVDFLYNIWAWGNTGGDRPTTSIAWEAMPFPPEWDVFFPDGLEMFYADANGDGFVNETDTEAIIANFGLTHGTPTPDNFQMGEEGEAPLLALIPSVNSIEAGTAFNIDLQLGNEDFFVESFYGIAIELSYTLAGSPEETQPEIDFELIEDSWINTDGTPIFDFFKHHPDNNTIELMISRTNGNAAVNNSGRIGSFSVIIEDIVLGLEDDDFHLEVENVRLIDAGFFTYPVVYGETDIEVIRNSTVACDPAIQTEIIDCPTVIFSDGTVTSPDDPVVSWFWDLGDGTTSTEQNFSHTYANEGIYVVCMTVATEGGCENTLCLDIIVNCANNCLLAMEVEQHSCSSYTFTAEAPPSVPIFWIVNDEFLQHAGNIFNFFTDEPGIYTICAGYETPDCPEGVTYCTIISVDPECFEIEHCDFEVVLEEYTCSSFGLYTAQGHEDVNWYINGEFISQGVGIDFDPQEAGLYEVCGELLNEETCPIGMTTCYNIKVLPECFEPQLTFQIEAAAGTTGSTIQVPVTVDNFSDMASFSFTIQTSIAPNVVDFIGIVDGALSDVSANPVDTETLLILWNDLTAMGQTFEDGTVLFYLEIALSGNPEDCTELFFNNAPLNIIAAQIENGLPVQVTPTTIGNAVCINNGPTKSGQITIETGEPLPGVTVFCDEEANFVLTDDNGEYSFTDLDPNGGYSIAPFLNDEPRNGVDIIDVFLMLSHINNVNLLDSPYKIIAADVNKDEVVDMTDFNQTRELLLLFLDEFPSANSWEFVVKDYLFPNPANPFVETYPELIQLANLTTDATDLDFIAVKKGDVNNEAPEFRGDNNLGWSVADRTLVSDEPISIPIRAKDFVHLSGFQAQINFSTIDLEYLGVEAGVLSDVLFGQELLDMGILTTNWLDLSAHPSGQNLEDDTVLFSLNFKAKTSGNSLSEVLHIEHELLSSFGFNTDFEQLSISLNFESQPVNTTNFEDNGFEVFAARPNPFTTETVIAFQLPSAADVSLTILDVSGKVVYQEDTRFEAGYQEYLFHKNLPHSGLYFYRLESTWGTHVGRLVVE